MVDPSQISCDIPLQWKIKIEQIATARKKTSQEIAGEAIALYLGENNEIALTRIQQLEAEVFTLRQNLTQLTTTVHDLQQRLTTAASVMATSPSPMTKKNTQPLTSFSDEEIEDEPDEILYDFLESKDR